MRGWGVVSAAQERLRTAVCAGVLIAGVVVAGSGSAAGAASAAPGVTASTILLGLETTLSGPAAPTFSDSAGGVQAAIGLQNAHGGIDGRKLKFIVADDQSSPVTAQTAAASLASKGVFGVIEDSAITSNFGTADTVLDKLGIPDVTWGADITNANTFSISDDAGVYGTKDYVFDTVGPFLKSLGVKSVGLVTYSSISESELDTIAAMKHDGIAPCYENTSLAVGALNFSVEGLAIDKSKCEATYAPLEDSSDVALASSIKQAGSTAVQVYETGYDNGILSSPSARSALDGAYVQSLVNMTTPNAATKVMLAAIKKYDTQYSGGLPDLGTWEAYAETELMIKGLELAGKNPTQASFEAALRKVNDYTAGGILSAGSNFSDFGQTSAIPTTNCYYFIRLQGDKYLPAHGGKPVCGKLYSFTH